MTVVHTVVITFVTFLQSFGDWIYAGVSADLAKRSWGWTDSNLAEGSNE